MIKVDKTSLEETGEVVLRMSAGDFDALHADVRRAVLLWDHVCPGQEDRTASAFVKAARRDTDSNLRELDRALEDLRESHEAALKAKRAARVARLDALD